MIVRKLTGYNKATEMLDLEFDLSDESLGKLSAISHPAIDHRSAMGGLPLDERAASEIAVQCGLHMDVVDRYDWFIEPFAS